MPVRPAVLRPPAEAAALARRAAELSPSPIFVVGGALRDLALGRTVRDLDLAAKGAAALAKALAGAVGGTLVVLDDKTQVYRVALGASFKTVRQVDIAEIQGGSIEADLARRDFTINALALPVAPRKAWSAASLLDPRGGLADLQTKRIRAESEALFKDDPLRLLRAVRIGAQLRFTIEPKTLTLIGRLRTRVLAPAGERIQAELLGLLSEEGASDWLRVMDECGLLTALFPDLEPSRRCAEVYYGAGGVLKHSLDACERADYLLSNVPKIFPEHSREVSAALTPKPASRALLMLATLLHDVSKPETAKTVDGRLRFFGHDTVGARRAADIMKKLKFSRAQIDEVSAVVAQHLRPGNLASGGVVTDKASYRFFRDLGPHALPLLLVCWADHASYLPQDRIAKLLRQAALDPDAGSAARARLKPEEARKTVFHLQVISCLMGRLFDADEKPVPERLLDGNEVMKALGLKPGPGVGKALEALREAQAVGKVKSREDALAFLEKLRSTQQ
jgi:poly(A) polymerase